MVAIFLLKPSNEFEWILCMQIRKMPSNLEIILSLPNYKTKITKFIYITLLILIAKNVCREPNVSQKEFQCLNDFDKL